MVIGTSPFHSRLDLASQPSAVRWARLHAQDVLTAWQVPPGTADDALLIVSELVTNAVRHASPPPAPTDTEAPRLRTCALAFQRMPDHLLICVHDQDRRPPVMKQATEDGEGGRGLHLIEELSAAWGYAYPTPAVGKTVWAKLAMDDAARPEAQSVPDRDRPATTREQPWLWRFAHR